jgi:hypothetical protein
MSPNKPTFEDYFEWYLNELKDKGYILSFKKEKEITPFEINQEIKIKKIKEITKTGIIKESDRKLIGKHTYKPDFLIYWTKLAESIFYEVITEERLKYNTFFLANEKDGYHFSFVDVKPPAIAAQFSGSFNSYATFPINQSIVMNLYNIYVNKVVPIPVRNSGLAVSLFPNTFTPNRFLFTDAGKAVRTIKFKTKTLLDFVRERNNYINYINQYIVKLI